MYPPPAIFSMTLAGMGGREDDSIKGGTFVGPPSSEGRATKGSEGREGQRSGARSSDPTNAGLGGPGSS